MAARFGCCDMTIVVILISIVKTVSGNTCSKWTEEDPVTACTQSIHVSNNIYLDFSNSANKLPCTCRVTVTQSANIFVMPLTTPSNGCGTEIVMGYSGNNNSVVIKCPTANGTDFVVSSGYLSITISLQAGYSSPVETDYCLNVNSGDRRPFNVSCESNNMPETTQVWSSTAFVDTTKPTSWSNVTASDVETTTTAASTKAVTIVLAVVGGLVALAIVCIISILCYRRRKLKTPATETSGRRDRFINDNDTDAKDLNTGNFQPCDRQYDEINRVQEVQLRDKSESLQKVFQQPLHSTQTQYDDSQAVDLQNPIQTNNDDGSTVIYAKPDKPVMKNSEKTKRNNQFPVYALPVKKKSNNETDQVKSKNQTKSLVNTDGLQYADLCLEKDTKYRSEQNFNKCTKSDIQYADLQL